MKQNSDYNHKSYTAINSDYSYKRLLNALFLKVVISFATLILLSCLCSFFFFCETWVYFKFIKCIRYIGSKGRYGKKITRTASHVPTALTFKACGFSEFLIAHYIPF